MKKIAFFLFIGLIFASCGKKEIKQVSQESKITQEAFAVIEKIKNAFADNDNTTLQQNSTSEGFKDITSNKKTFESVEIIFTPRWVEIGDKKVEVNIAWQCAWMGSGRKTEERGMAVFILEGSPLKVSKILRANPFVYPEQ
jgi:hypothetical protein